MSFVTPRLRASFAALALLAFAAPASAHSYKAGSLEIGHPWSRETAPGAKVGAGYLKITNTGTTPDRLIAVESPGADKVEVHESKSENGVARMRRVDAVDIPAGGTVALAPGGYHLMLMGLKEGLAEGVRVPATLTFEKAGKLEIELAIESMGYGGPGGEHDAAPAEHKHH